MAIGVARQGAKKAGRRGKSPFSCWPSHGPNVVCGRTRVCACTFFPRCLFERLLGPFWMNSGGCFKKPA